MTNKNNIAAYKLWCQALRSGDYKEDFRTVDMRTVTNQWDPIGVLADVSKLGRWEPIKDPKRGLSMAYIIGKQHWISVMPVPVGEWLGIYPLSFWQYVPVFHPTLGKRDVMSLFLGHKLTFRQLAEVIEENYAHDLSSEKLPLSG